MTTLHMYCAAHEMVASTSTFKTRGFVAEWTIIGITQHPAKKLNIVQVRFQRPKWFKDAGFYPCEHS